MPDLLNVHWPYGEEYVPIPADGASSRVLKKSLASGLVL
jgi:hypothetical protein